MNETFAFWEFWKWSLQLWGVIGTWVASFGTVGAVVVSLWLAYHQNAIRLRVSASLGRSVETGGGSVKRFCWIRVTNIGNRSAKIAIIAWKIGRGKAKKNFIQLFSSNRYVISDDIPKILTEGEEANYYLPIGTRDEYDWSLKFVRSMKECGYDEMHLKTLKIVISTSVGRTFKAKTDVRLIQYLLEEYRKINS